MDYHVHLNEGKMGEFLARHDLVYDRPADIWDRGIPMANSIVSALIWGEEKLNVTLNRLDVWEMRHYEPDPERFKWREYVKLLQEKRGNDYEGLGQKGEEPAPQQIPIGRFEVTTKGKEQHDYRMRLSLYDAVATGSYGTELGGIQWKCYVSANNHPVVIFNYKVFGDEEVSVKFRFATELDEYAKEYEELFTVNPNRTFRPFKNVKGYPDGLPEFSRVLRDWGYPEPERAEDGVIKYFSQKIPQNGNYAVAWTVIDIAENEKTIIVSMTCDSENGKAEEDAIRIAEELRDPAKLIVEEDAHKRWWHNYYPKSFYSIQDTRLEALYWINTYKLGCATRIDGIAPPMDGPWQPDDGSPEFIGNTYIWNTQQQVQLFGIYTANRLEQGMSTYNLLINNRHKMAEYCKAFFEVDGEFLPHLTDWTLTCPNYNPDHFELLSGPWMMQLMWNHYKYSMDENFLRETLYPMLKAQSKPVLAQLERWDDGKFHFPYTMSAEYQGEQESTRWSLNIETDFTRRYGPDATCDLGYTRFMCSTLLEATKILGIDDEDIPVWEETLRDLADFCLDEFGGLMVRRDLKLESTHRHLTHLFPITQLHQITCDTPEGRSIIDKSLYVLKLRGTGEWMGWTFSETAKLALLDEKPALAYTMVKEYCDKYIHENTFDCEGSNYDCAMTMQGNTGLTVESDGMFNDALQEFAIRSYNGEIHIMDILPGAFTDISFWKFRTEGAFLISAQRRNGRTDFISIYSEAGQKANIISCYGTKVDILCDGEETDYIVENNKIVFETEAGKEYIITKKGEKPENLWIEAVEPKAYEVNYFGIKKNSRY